MVENDSDGNCCSVRVAVRVRPLIGREKVDRCSECITVYNNSGEEEMVIIGKD